MSEAKFKVAIVGAGIGGLVFALSLHRFNANVDVDIYEAAAEFTEVGAGVGVWPRAWELLKDLGLADELAAVSEKAPGSWLYRKADQREGIPFNEVNDRVAFTTFYRAEFQSVLAKHLPAGYNIYFSKRLTSYAEIESGKIRLEFKDKSSATCDVLVGCDGIKSAVRNAMFRHLAAIATANGDDAAAADLTEKATPQWTGVLAYRGVFPAKALREVRADHVALERPLLSFGKHKLVATYPVSQGRLINFAAYVSNTSLEGTSYGPVWVRKSSKDEFASDFSMFEVQMKELLECVDTVNLWAIHVLPPLPTYVSGRVAILGDAAHAMTPFQGSGAGQGAEDGYILAAILSHPAVTARNVENALKAYDAVRRPISQEVSRISWKNLRLYALQTTGLEKLSEEASASGAVPVSKLEEVGRELCAAFEWVKFATFAQDRDTALEMLEKELLQADGGGHH
ncbi:salicylate 1-monooxygenase [Wolfiporia cocos MD-104 SS10]|uniref:Salicylate 1-monooxygenase n=1 Tax=Wolfiporia cocos (strain MD-104) TaxID=742152 RepID=A0A2H3JDH9_WOLCO|nr:salicylate 1-monooxygenase [Wolfiporia cocos MD-104 SS10]